ncbi:CubicO group peptidase, beta-lactamase class C family [Duganella sp. CF458]|uniref:serine hydrolase domain-containing protein n=1 Tax=Duganella sp. CF458 TaxID=1884368 RepID=UPI0008E1941F|nr:serine hydrolase [Duganella sp. CF458]SFF61918.1 CubicO group peptidase, beta-lactamase class C family [Duganella sp. CF458]
MQKGMSVLVGAVLLGSIGHAWASKLDTELAAIVNDAQHPLAGLSVLAIRDGKVAYQQQFGLRRLAATGRGVTAPVTPQTMFRIASISKMMTAFGVMKLVEEGKLKLDTDAGEYLGFALRNPNYPNRAITLRHLLSHTSTLRDDDGYFWSAGTALREVLVPTGKMWARDGEPGRYFTYANLNWAVIGTIMERVTGERFDRLMQRLLLAPMGLRGGYNPAGFSQQEVADTATLYRRRTRDTEVWDSKGPWIAQADDFGVLAPQEPPGLDQYVIGTNATPFSPTGGLRLSAGDLGKIMLMLINQGRHEGQQVIAPASLAVMFGEQWRFNGSNGQTLKGLYHSWGLGTQRFADVRGNMGGMPKNGRFHAVGHLGEAYGLVATFAVDLKKKQGIVSLIGGFGSDPDADPGLHSAHTRAEERILDAIYQRAILGRGD